MGRTCILVGFRGRKGGDECISQTQPPPRPVDTTTTTKIKWINGCNTVRIRTHHGTHSLKKKRTRNRNFLTLVTLFTRISVLCPRRCRYRCTPSPPKRSFCILFSSRGLTRPCSTLTRFIYIY